MSLDSIVVSLQSVDPLHGSVHDVVALLQRAAALTTTTTRDDDDESTRRLLTALLEHTWLHWAARLPDVALLDAFFDARSPAPAAALSAVLAAPAAPAAHWLQRYVDEGLFRALFAAHLRDVDAAALARALLAAPTRLANAMRGHVPPGLREHAFVLRVLLDAIHAAATPVAVALLAHAVSLGLVDVAGAALHRFVAARSALVRSLLLAAPDQVQARLLAALLRRSSPDEARAVLGADAASSLLTASPAIEHFVSAAALHGNQPLASLALVDVVIAHLVALAAPIESPLHVARLADDVATVWGAESFVSGAAPDAEAYLTHVLLRLLPHVGAEHVGAQGTLLTRLIDGVRHRLSSPLRPVRIDGMRVGEAFSLLLDPSNPLVFDELKSEPPPPPNEKPPQPPHAPADEPKRRAPKRAPAALDPDAVVFNDDDDDDVDEDGGDADDAAADSDDEFVALDLNESDDEQASSDALTLAGTVSSAPGLSHIGELIVALGDQENAARFEAALGKLPSALRAKPDDIDFETTTAGALAAQLLHLHNRFALESFVENRLASLCELCCAAPAPVARYLTTVFYDTSLDMQQRMLILEVLSRAAQRLAGVDFAASTPAPPVVAVAKRPLIEVVGQTRRWGDAERRREVAPSSASAFRGVAEIFFFELMRHVDKQHVQLRLMSGTDDGLLLGRLVQCAAIVVECAGAHHPLLERMARLLLDFVLVVRFHREPFVRRACAFAVVATTSTLPAHARTAPLLVPLLLECRAWLDECAANDADPDVRELAKRPR